ncbi:hypothetical protein CDSM653_01461 [Caldanaerobacter subterraneus subsp. pacificus DSM 12653]|uniref:Uncharacterized protein n=1 Tax=Caldanaerobacter subterraneus subsp. pacificus DSM 12653 TaxID=391606 RepID=A0A0F5PLI6_9THEO|nr:hypothetical protein CDSM653_01461 [Caldanaerobacter subterraneus subsp. pacificus DSM 12653]
MSPTSPKNPATVITPMPGMLKQIFCYVYFFE